MDLTLYEIFWSHYCEKARWCLDFKRLPHALVRVNPLTRREVRAIGGRGEVPVLRDGERVIEGSDAIAAYLDRTYPEPPLVPTVPDLRHAVLDLERRCGDELGVDARRVGYQVALENPVLLEGTLLFSRPPGRWINRLLLPFIEARLRRRFAIRPDEVGRSGARLHLLLRDLQERLAGRDHLVGDRLTLADITVVALMDPLEIVPEFVRAAAYRPIFEWKRRTARRHGRRQRAPWLEGPAGSGVPLGPGAP